MLHDPWLPALAAAFCFGAALVLTQRGLAYLTPAQGAATSVPCSALLLWLVVPFQFDPSRFDAQGFVVFAAVGLLFPAAVTLLTFEANRRMGPHIAGALGNLAPLFAVAAAVVMLGEAPSRQQILGLGVIVGGVVLLSLGRRGGSAAWPIWTLALPLAAAAIRGLIQPATKLGLGYWPSPFAAVLTGYTVSATVILASAWAGGVPMPRDRRGLGWFALVGLGNASAVLLMYAALARGPVALVSPLVATYPLVTLALSPLLLGRVQIGPRVAIGIVATVGGVVLLLAR